MICFARVTSVLAEPDLSMASTGFWHQSAGKVGRHPAELRAKEATEVKIAWKPGF